MSEAVKQALALAAGAVCGAALRHWTTLRMAARFGPAFPYGTLLINVIGSFILGCFLAASATRSAAHPQLRLLIATGFCGSFTTFSTFSYETVALLSDGRYVAGTINIVGSVALGLISVLLGIALARAVF